VLSRKEGELDAAKDGFAVIVKVLFIVPCYIVNVLGH
jgi:hypothetical protein